MSVCVCVCVPVSLTTIIKQTNKKKKKQVFHAFTPKRQMWMLNPEYTAGAEILAAIRLNRSMLVTSTDKQYLDAMVNRADYYTAWLWRNGELPLSLNLAPIPHSGEEPYLFCSTKKVLESEEVFPKHNLPSQYVSDLVENAAAISAEVGAASFKGCGKGLYLVCPPSVDSLTIPKDAQLGSYYGEFLFEEPSEADEELCFQLHRGHGEPPVWLKGDVNCPGRYINDPTYSSKTKHIKANCYFDEKPSVAYWDSKLICFYAMEDLVVEQGEPLELWANYNFKGSRKSITFTIGGQRIDQLLTLSDGNEADDEISTNTEMEDHSSRDEVD